MGTRMKDYGFLRVAAAKPSVKPGDVTRNVECICSLIDEAAGKEVSLIVFPELCLTGYTCGDLFGQDTLLDAAEQGTARIMEHSRGKDITIVAGTPVRSRDRLYNCAAVIRNGNIKGLVPKIHIPTYNEFYESRWFSPGTDFMTPATAGDGHFISNGKDSIREGFTAETEYAGFRCNISPNMIFEIGNIPFGIEICEDLWTPVPPSSWLAIAGARVIVNLSASNEVLMKHEYRRTLVCQQSARTVSGYIYSSAGYGESTQDMTYAGAALICENGSILAENERFVTGPQLLIADIDCGKLAVLRQKMNTFKAYSPDGTEASGYGRLYSRVPVGKPADTDFNSMLYRYVEPHPFVPGGYGQEMKNRCREIFSMQVSGLMTRLDHIRCRTAVIGISGGLDSTLALLVTAMAFDRLGWERSRIIGITMPGYGTTCRTHGNAWDLMHALGITSKEISITAACDRHFMDIGHDKDVHDITYENSQARERTQILMDVANQNGGIVIGTGDLSELALGWATYNGDHMSMYAVNASIPKTLVRHLVRWIADNHFASGATGAGDMEGASGIRTVRDILLDIIDTPISPELLPADNNGNILQKTEDLVGPYELHDFFLYNFFRFGYTPEKILFLAEKAFCSPQTHQDAEQGQPWDRYDRDTVKKWLKIFFRRFFSQQFKRSCLPDGPKVGSVTLSPRGDWRMPSDASASLFLDNLDRLD